MPDLTPAEARALLWSLVGLLAEATACAERIIAMHGEPGDEAAVERKALIEKKSLLEREIESRQRRLGLPLLWRPEGEH